MFDVVKLWRSNGVAKLELHLHDKLQHADIDAADKMTKQLRSQT